jgi:hypothetical protein
MPSATVARTVADRCRSRHQGHLPLARRGFRSENGGRLGAASAEGVPSYKVVVESDDIKVKV